MPQNVITQIGSLPFSNVEQAIEYSLRHDIPFLPELPLLGDSMLEYFQRPGQLSCLAAFKAHRFRTVKVQCIGPVTLLLARYTEDQALEGISRHLAGVLKGLLAEEIILFLDEPALGQTGIDFEPLWEAVFDSLNAPVLRGVHCCGRMNWDQLFRIPSIDFISFDASMFDITDYAKYRSGKRIAWGASKAEDVKDFQPGDLLTPPCGMSPQLFTAEVCEQTLRTLQHIKQQLGIA